MATAATHIENISIAIALAPPPSVDNSFRQALFLRDGITLNGANSVTYTSLDAVQADVAAGYADAIVEAAATAYFANQDRPRGLVVGRYDSGSAETLADGLDRALLDGTNFYVVVVDTRVAAAQVAFAADIQSREASDQRFLYLAQSSDSDWLTAGVPAAYSTMTQERAIVVFHDTDGVRCDAGWAARALNYDPSERSAPWDAPVRDVAALAASVTSAQRAACIANNANIGLAYGSEAFFIDPGVNVLGRACYELVTADWVYLELRKRVAAVKTKRSLVGRKYPITAEGQALTRSIVDGLISDGVTAGHFVDGQYLYTDEPITAADRAAQRLRFSFETQMQGSARLFEFNVELTRDPIFVQE